MRKAALLVFVLFAIFSCQKEEIPSITPKLKNCRVEYLFFQDDIMMKGDQSYSFPPDDPQNTKCSYFYDDGKINKLIGGFFTIPSGANFSNQAFSKDVYDSICSTGRTIYIYKKYVINDSVSVDKYNPIIFNLDSHKKLIKITKKDGALSNEYDLNYNYSENQINETYNNGKVRRKFYFEKNNLIKVVSEVFDSQGLILFKKEILFQEFDDKPNPFKNMYYVRGAFFRAFSDNNYKSFTINEYMPSSDGTLALTKYCWFSMPIQYNTDSYPMFGDYEE